MFLYCQGHFNTLYPMEAFAASIYHLFSKVREKERNLRKQHQEDS